MLCSASRNVMCAAGVMSGCVERRNRAGKTYPTDRKVAFSRDKVTERSKVG